MEWVIGIYFVVGAWKAWGMLLSDVTDRPMWTYTEKNPIVWALYLLVWVLIWPLAARKSGG